MAYWALLVVVPLMVWCLYVRYSRAGRLMAKIPGPPEIPFIGNAFVAILPLDKLFTFLRDLYRTFGGMTKLYSFHWRSINIYEPEDMETILSTTRFNEKYWPYLFLKPWLADGLLVSNGEKWQQRRKMLTPAFHFNILKKYTQTFTEQAEGLVRAVQEEVGKEQTALQPLITNTTLNIIMETSMGVAVHDGKDSDVKSYFDAVHTLGQCVVMRLCRVWYINDFIFYFSKIRKAQTKALKVLHTFRDAFIQKRQAYLKNNDVTEFTDHNDQEVYGKRGRLAMMDLLIQNEKNNKIDLNGIREEVDTFTFEGHDTIATALCFMIMRIANEPDIQEKIYEELSSIFSDSQRPARMDDFNEMKYLECCIKESLRIYPSVPFIARLTNEEVVLSGYTVPGWTSVNIHIYDMHHRADLYPEPENFVPERFLPENSLKRHPYAYIPFSAGPRNCIGQKFAMLEMKSIMSSLIRKFRLEPVTKPDQIVMTTDLILRATHPLYVRFCDRQQ